jgi:hypothetical protein
MNEVQVDRMLAGTERRENVTDLRALRELVKTRKALRRYRDAHAFAVRAVGTSRNMAAGDRFWRHLRAGGSQEVTALTLPAP